MFGLDLGCLRKTPSQGRHDLDTFDGIDAKIGVQPHVEIQHLSRITGLVGHDIKDGLGNSCRNRRRFCRSSFRNFDLRSLALDWGLDWLGQRSGFGRDLRAARRSSMHRHRCRSGSCTILDWGEPQNFPALAHQGFQCPAGGFLAFEELAVQLSGLLLQLLKCEHALLRGLQCGSQIG